MLVTITIPVIAHITTVSQNVALIDTRACSPGLFVLALDAAIPAVPSPASLVNNPQAIPYLAALLIELPTKPPTTALGTKAEDIINLIAGIM